MGRLVRIASVITLFVSLALVPSQAAARQAHDYVYQSYIDGSGSSHGQFPNLADVMYDPDSQRLLVGVVGYPSYITGFTQAGTPETFGGIGSDSITIPGEGTVLRLARDRSPASSHGDIYATTRGFYLLNEGTSKFAPDGSEITDWLSPREPCGLDIDEAGYPWSAGEFGHRRKLNPDGTHISQSGHSPGEEIAPFPYSEKGGIKFTFAACGLTYGAPGIAYAWQGGSNSGRPVQFDPATGEEEFQLNESSTSDFSIDYSNGTVYAIQGNVVRYFAKDGTPLGEFGAPDPAHSFEGLQEPRGVAVDPLTHDVWVADNRPYGANVRLIEFAPSPTAVTVPTVSIEEPIYADTSATIRGTLDPEGVETTDCHFEWGSNQGFFNSVPCAQGSNHSDNAAIPVSAVIAGLTRGQPYYYRLSSENGNGRVALSAPKRFIAQKAPSVSRTLVDEVKTDGARFNTDVKPNGGDTTVKFEWGPAGGSFEHSTDTTELAKLLVGEHIETSVSGLTPGTRYQMRSVVSNQAATIVSAPIEFETHVADSGIDNCANSLARHQTGSSLLLDCRGYELVSAANTGGFDVESSLVEGQSPLLGYPDAHDRVLYSVHAGVIPGSSGSPTNLGRDPYLATRGEEGWTTRYVGLPADGMADPGSFGSPLLAADPLLTEFAFGGADICDPCFADDGSTNIPLRRADGTLEKGMQGPQNPAADPVGYVAQRFSADGTHFIFGADKAFVSGSKVGSVSIYDRNLKTDETQIVSTDSNGAVMGGEVGELGVSSNGGRVVVGELVHTEGAAKYWHLFMHLGNSSDSIDLDPTSTTGVLFDGMTADASGVFFSTADSLLPSDTDESVDIYEAEVSPAGALSLRIVSAKPGGISEDDNCDPTGRPDSWNASSGAGRCNAVAIAGGGGVATGRGTIYFLSPELLDGPANGALGEVNLYVAKPGADPRFVATIDSSAFEAPPAPDLHPLGSTSFLSGLSTAAGIAVDQSTHDVYVVESGAPGFARFTSAGAPDPFPALGATNKISNPGVGAPGEAQIAVDNASSSALEGDVYVRSGPSSVAVYAPSGEELGTITGFGSVCGVAVDQQTGAVYVGDSGFGGIHRLLPAPAAAAPVNNADYSETSIKTVGVSPCAVAADSSGHVYATEGGYGPLFSFSASDFTGASPHVAGQVITGTSLTVAVDPATEDLYVSEGERISQFDSSGSLLQTFGSGNIGYQSRGLAIDAQSGAVYASNESNVVSFGDEPVPYAPIENPAAIHGVTQPGTHEYSDFQVSADGRFAIFGSVIPLTGYENFGHSEIYRYDAEAESVDCVSCPATGVAATTDTDLPQYGRGLTDDGRVFFTSKEPIALRDTDGKNDAYEWSGGEQELISTGISSHDSGLLTVSADGQDAYFFTRDTLVSGDLNGATVKLYDAREGGGFVVDPRRPQCAASDECHGAGTEPAPAPEINTVIGSGRTPGPSRHCRKGFVKRHGHCSKKKHRHHHKRRKGGSRR